MFLVSDASVVFFSLCTSQVIDLDAHQGNGHERALMQDRDKYIVDVFNASIYPGDHYAAQGIDLAVPVRKWIGDAEYLAKLQQTLVTAFQNFANCEMVIYNAGEFHACFMLLFCIVMSALLASFVLLFAGLDCFPSHSSVLCFPCIAFIVSLLLGVGTDCLVDDPLGCMSLTEDGIIKRDEMVFREALARGIPIVMVLSGGYQKNNAQLIARSIANLVQKFNLFGSVGGAPAPAVTAAAAVSAAAAASLHGPDA